MSHRTVRVFLCLLVLVGCARPVLFGQTAMHPDIYEHFLGVWVGSGVYVKNGVRQKIPVKVTITEKKDQLRLDYVYGQKGTPDFNRETRFLRLNPPKEEFDLRWEDSSKETYKATGLDEFAKSGFGKFTGSRMNHAGAEQDRIFRVIFELKDGTFSYEWQHGPDENHLAFLSIYTLSRSASAGQP